MEEQLRRFESWSQHFTWQGAVLIAKTPVGIATIDMLRINLPERVAFRKELLKAGVFPSS